MLCTVNEEFGFPRRAGVGLVRTDHYLCAIGVKSIITDASFFR